AKAEAAGNLKSTPQQKVTTQAEELPEQETADMLNHHFALLGACIEADDGVIDKYIGDCVMAVWGGISKMEDHADHAVHAALEMARVVREDNAQRAAAGQAPVRLRVGLHSGPVVVGNIGAPGRVNYTVVGDTVNVAQRFEQLGKEFMREGEDVIVLVSGDTISAMKHPETLGTLPTPELRHVKGRDEPEQVYRLV
ncbi:MAG: adenylate/guanylate cyclase domain-containing protein, partial [Reyranella sp.]